uniref:CYP711A8 n=1 Tax=Arundo donax TaxID=35708 RepID=A0A0A9E6B2_ARUDO
MNSAASPPAPCAPDAAVRPKSTPNAACPMTSVASLRNRSEKSTSPCSRSAAAGMASAARSTQRCMVGMRPARCVGWYSEMMVFLIADHLSSLVKKSPLWWRGEPAMGAGKLLLGMLLNCLTPTSLQSSGSATITRGCLPKWNLKIGPYLLARRPKTSGPCLPSSGRCPTTGTAGGPGTALTPQYGA